MLTKLRGRVTYANVVATLALFIALGGTSVAAIQLGKNSVKAKQIAPGAVGTSEVKNGGLKAIDFAKGQLPQSGLRNLVVRQFSATVPGTCTEAGIPPHDDLLLQRERADGDRHLPGRRGPDLRLGRRARARGQCADRLQDPRHSGPGHRGRADDDPGQLRRCSAPSPRASQA